MMPGEYGIIDELKP
jgi:hypothetical protein